MNTAVAGTTSDGTSAQNIGFAIPSAQIESLLPTLENGGTKTSTPGYLGVFVTTLTPQLRSEYGLTPISGAIVTDIVAGGPAAQAGTLPGRRHRRHWVQGDRFASRRPVSHPG